MTTTINSRSGEKGFTLVELAIVMIIIGLLIGGILKGQELIANARLASAVSKTKAIDAALNTFRDSYSGLPGDILAPGTRLPGCALRCATAGNGNSQIGVGPGAIQAAASENLVAWAQLAVTDLLGGVQNTPVATVVSGGTTNPSAEIPGQIFIGYASGLTGLATPTTSGTAKAGHYLLIHNGVGTTDSVAASSATTSITPSQASRIDAKLDDGLPNTGSVLAMGTTGTSGCSGGATDSATDNLYTTANEASSCGIYVRIQQ